VHLRSLQDIVDEVSASQCASLAAEQVPSLEPLHRECQYAHEPKGSC